jgi:ribose transport system substrate-binding protein
VLAPQYGGGDQADSANITKSIISSNPDLKGIYASNEGSAIDAIKDGSMAGAVTQDPINVGRRQDERGRREDQGRPLPVVQFAGRSRRPGVSRPM